MQWTVAFVALLGFAIVNTAILGYNAYSGASTNAINFPSAGTALSASSTTTVITTSTATQTVTEPGTATGTQVSETSSSSGPTYTASQTTQSTQTASSPSTTNLSNSQFGIAVTGASEPSISGVLFGFLEQHSLVLAPTSWFAVGGMWIWRGRMRSKWTDLGFDSDVFTLFVKMKGAKTRIRLLDALSVPKDRLQLAEELGLDWKSVDRHVSVMKKYGFLDDNVAYGRVSYYRLTPSGVSLLKLLQELNTDERREDNGALPARGEA